MAMNYRQTENTEAKFKGCFVLLMWIQKLRSDFWPFETCKLEQVSVFACKGHRCVIMEEEQQRSQRGVCGVWCVCDVVTSICG